MTKTDSDRLLQELPTDRLYHPEFDLWVLAEPNGLYRIGVTAYGIFLAGELMAFCAKPRGAEVAYGRGFGTVESRKTVHALHAPIALRLLEGNEAAEDRPALINQDPYNVGWMILAQADDWARDAARLVSADVYRGLR